MSFTFKEKYNMFAYVKDPKMCEPFEKSFSDFKVKVKKYGHVGASNEVEILFKMLKSITQ